MSSSTKVNVCWTSKKLSEFSKSSKKIIKKK